MKSVPASAVAGDTPPSEEGTRSPSGGGDEDLGAVSESSETAERPTAPPSDVESDFAAAMNAAVVLMLEGEDAGAAADDRCRRPDERHSCGGSGEGDPAACQVPPKCQEGPGEDRRLRRSSAGNSRRRSSSSLSESGGNSGATAAASAEAQTTTAVLPSLTPGAVTVASPGTRGGIYYGGGSSRGGSDPGERPPPDGERLPYERESGGQGNGGGGGVESNDGDGVHRAEGFAYIQAARVTPAAPEEAARRSSTGLVGAAAVASLPPSAAAEDRISRVVRRLSSLQEPTDAVSVNVIGGGDRRNGPEGGRSRRRRQLSEEKGFLTPRVFAWLLGSHQTAVVAIVAILAVALVAVLVPLLVRGERGGDSAASAHNDSGSSAGWPIGGGPSSSSPQHPPEGHTATAAAQEDDPVRARIFEAALSLSSESDLLDPSSPQYRAASWLADSMIASSKEEEITKTSPTLSLPNWRLEQRYALAVLYQSTGGSEGWWLRDDKFLDPDVNECKWHGMECHDGDNGGSNRDGRAASLRLDTNNLTGTIPSELRVLSDLTHFNMSNNALGPGRLPPWIGTDLPRLEELALMHSQLSGQIPPSIGDLSSLRVLDLRYNDLTGTMEPLGRLSNLEVLALWVNRLGGSIPASFGTNLKKLRMLDVGRNELTGTLDVLPGMTDLRYVQLWVNRLTGSIPSELGVNLGGRLEFFHAMANRLNGTLPETMGQLIRLDTLSIGDNLIGGPIPPSLGRMGRLRNLHLNNLRLTGAIPSELSGLTELASVTLDNNRLTGTIPADLGIRLGALRLLTLHGNHLTGSLPFSLGGEGNMPNLSLLDVADNPLNGTVPASFGDLPRLVFLSLTGTDLTGSVDPFCGVSAFYADCGVGAGSAEPPVSCQCCDPGSCCEPSGIDISGAAASAGGQCGLHYHPMLLMTSPGFFSSFLECYWAWRDGFDSRCEWGRALDTYFDDFL